MAAACLLAMIACDMPVGLGSRINTDVPVIRVPGPRDGIRQPGDFLNYRTNIVLLDIGQPQGFPIESAFMTVEWIEDGEIRTRDIPGERDSATGYWRFNIDTIELGLPDDQIQTRVTAIDSTGRRTTTTDIIFRVKNTPPQIELTIPSIAGAQFDDDRFMRELFANDPVFVPFDLMGLATDDAGIELGWPKIQIWRVDGHSAMDITGRNIHVDFYGVPLDGEVPWRSMVVPNPRQGLTSARITWPMVQLIPDSRAPGGHRLPQGNEPRAPLPGGTYRFRIEIEDVFGNINTYPNRVDNTLGPGGTPLPPGEHPVRFIEIHYMVSEVPIVDFTSVPETFNGKGPFTIEFRVSSINYLNDVAVFIANNRVGGPGPGPGPGTSPEVRPPIPTRVGEGLYTFNVTLDAADWPMPDGGLSMFVHVVATDDTGRRNPQAARDFIFDTTPPEVRFERPFNIANPRRTPDISGEFSSTYNSIQTRNFYEVYHPERENPRWVTGVVTVGGWASDPSAIVSGGSVPTSGLRRVYYHIGDRGDDAIGRTTAERANIFRTIPWVDTRLDTNFPAPGWTGNLHTWSYTRNFNEFRRTHPLLIQEAAAFGFPDRGPDDPDCLTGTRDRERFYLPFYVKVLDWAGNVTILHYKLAIDPEMDIPIVEINFPGENDLVGGEVRLSGVAMDNIWVDTVLIRIERADWATWQNLPHPSGGTNGRFYIPVGQTPFFPRPGFPQPPNNDTDGWFEADRIGNGPVIAWFHNINGDNRLDPPFGQEQLAVKIEVRAIDSQDIGGAPHRIGPAEVLNVRFSSGVPTITTPYIRGMRGDGDGGRRFVQGSVVSRTVTFSMYVRDDDGFDRIQARLGNAPFTQIVVNDMVQSGLPAGWSATRVTEIVDPSRPYSFRLEFEINTEALFPTSGYTSLEIVADDNSTPSFRTSSVFNFNVDNFAPFFHRIDEPPVASGSSFILRGQVRDYNPTSGPVQGLERVLVYFEEARVHFTGPGRTRSIVGTGRFLNPRGVPIGGTDAFYATGRGSTFGRNEWATIPPMVGGFPLLRLIDKGFDGMVWESPHAMVIDSQEIGAYTDTDGDGTYGEVWPNVADREWQVRMNTENFPSGPLVIHYIVMDHAGNYRRESRPIFIENDRPVITEFNVGTDIRGTGTVDPFVSSTNPGGFRTVFSGVTRANQTASERVSGNSQHVFNPTFRVRNNRLAFNIRTQAGTGNSGLNFRISHVTQGVAINAGEMVRGNVYTIVTTGNTDWLQYGAPASAVNVTFVASGRGTGTGTVRRNNVERDIPFVPSGSGNDRTLTVSDFTGIPESTGTNDRLFIVKVYDNTVGQVVVDGTPQTTVPTSEQLAHAILVAVTINNIDSVAPSISVAPFGQRYTAPDWENVQRRADVADYNDNIVMSGNTRLGYVQYAIHSQSGVADLSGQVRFLGRAADDQRIRSISVTIPGFRGGAAFEVATWNNAEGALVPVRTDMGTGDNAWYFEIVNERLTLDHGHALNWMFAWDTSSVTNQVGTPTVVFTIRDHGASGGNAATGNLPVNIAPFISEIITGFSGVLGAAPSAFARSSRGWYPVREDEVIIIRGFNLGSSTLTGVRIGPDDPARWTNLTHSTAATVASGNFRVVDSTEIHANVGLVATSGALTVFVGTQPTVTDRTPSLNNRTRLLREGVADTIANRLNAANRIAYNWEPNNVNNNILTNERKLYIWSVGHLVDDGNIGHPFMRVGPSGTRVMAFNSGVNSSNLIRRINNTNLITETTMNRYRNITVAIGNRDLWYLGVSNQTAAAVSFNLHARRGATGANSAAGNNKSRILALGANSETRVQVPRIHARDVSATESRVTVSFFDNDVSRVYFLYGSVEGTQDAHTAANATANVTTFSGNFAIASAAAFSTRQQVATATSTHPAGSAYTAVASLSNGQPVIAWFTGQNLVISYGHRNPTNTSHVEGITYADWQGRATVVQRGAGMFVDMAVDPQDNVHLAFYDHINGGLHYAFIPRSGIPIVTAGGPTNRAPITEIRTARVDTFLSAGMNLMISVRDETANGIPRFRPYISYFHGAFPGTRSTVRVAWPVTEVNAAGNFAVENNTDSSDFFRGTWEVMSVPAINIPGNSLIISNGVPRWRNGWIPVTGAGGLRGHHTGAAGTTGSTATSLANRTILVGYMTDRNFEGAMLKYDIFPGAPTGAP